MAIKLKASSSTVSSPFSFDIQPPAADDPHSPPTSWLSARDMKIYGSRPLSATSEIGVVKCKECGKPVLRSFMADHADACALLRAGGKKGKIDVEDSKVAGKKRKSSPSSEEPAKKKTKPTPKVTKGRIKGPLDLDKQCGVINDKGLPCSRSLTCKSHSMGAKRAVTGRSKKYDELLLEWQRANNPNFVEPIKRETKAEKKEKREKEKLEKKRLAEEAAAAMGLDPAAIKKAGAASVAKKSNKKTSSSNVALRLADQLRDDSWADLDDLDSEVEIEELINSVKLAAERGSIGVPLAVPCDASSWFVQRRERARCCRDLLLNALGSSGGASATGNAMINSLVSRSASLSSGTTNLRLP